MSQSTVTCCPACGNCKIQRRTRKPGGNGPDRDEKWFCKDCSHYFDDPYQKETEVDWPPANLAVDLDKARGESGDEWDPEPAELRDGETPDDDAHARRNAAMLRTAERELNADAEDGDRS